MKKIMALLGAGKRTGPTITPLLPDSESAGRVLQTRQQMIQTVRWLAMTVLVTGVASVITLTAAIWMLFQKPEPVYFATRTNGELIPLVPLHEPHLGTAQILHFATQAVTRANTFDFANYRLQLTEVRDYFTDEGYQAFVEALNASGNLKLVINRRMTTTAVANGGVIIDQGLSSSSRSDSYMWRVQIPLVITYQSSEESQVQDLIVQLEITRIPTWKNEWGVAIRRMITRSNR